jgi:hypothetical protein
MNSRPSGLWAGGSFFLVGEELQITSCSQLHFLLFANPALRNLLHFMGFDGLSMGRISTG